MKKLRFFNKNILEHHNDVDCATEVVSNTISNSTDKKKIQSEYHETLYAGQSFSHQSSDVLQFRDIQGIESTVDTLGYLSKKHLNSDVERRVDAALLKQPPMAIRKQAKVLYVVSKPTPGQVHGDWAVRSHGKIYSHHRTKKNAVKKAREIALKRDATVIVQNMDGTFQKSYKPRVKKK